MEKSGGPSAGGPGVSKASLLGCPPAISFHNARPSFFRKKEIGKERLKGPSHQIRYAWKWNGSTTFLLIFNGPLKFL
jgi:hypothetical protein